MTTHHRLGEGHATWEGPIRAYRQISTNVMVSCWGAQRLVQISKICQLLPVPKEPGAEARNYASQEELELALGLRDGEGNLDEFPADAGMRVMLAQCAAWPATAIGIETRPRRCMIIVPASDATIAKGPNCCAAICRGISGVNMFTQKFSRRARMALLRSVHAVSGAQIQCDRSDWSSSHSSGSACPAHPR
jgi:hypothetical protein